MLMLRAARSAGRIASCGLELVFAGWSPEELEGRAGVAVLDIVDGRPI